MDYRNKANFSDSFAILYGHRMNTGRMFTDVGKYLNAKFFREHSSGRIFVPGGEFVLSTYLSAQLSAEHEAYVLEDKLDWDFERALDFVDLEFEEQLVQKNEDLALSLRRELREGIKRDRRVVMLSTCTRGAPMSRDVLVVIAERIAR